MADGIPVRIESGGRRTGGKLVIDGTDFSNHVASLHLEMGAGMMPRLTVDFAGLVTAAEVGAEVVIPDEVQALLLKLGWTAPAPEPTEGEV